MFVIVLLLNLCYNLERRRNLINITIDEITPCLKDLSNGDLVETEVVKINRKSYLSKFNKKNGWYTNWNVLADENEIYALVLKGTVDIQGLVALQPLEEYEAVYVTWMCTAPQNNPIITENQKYAGVGGHLFAIAAERSISLGFGGAITGNAANMELVEHYCSVFGAIHIGILHPFQFFIDENNAKQIKEAYDYEWTDDEL